MKHKFYIFILFSIVFFGSQNSIAQKIWSLQDQSNTILSKKEIYQKKHFPKNYKIFSLNKSVLETSFKDLKTKKSILELPDTDGNLSRYEIEETSNFNVVLSKKYPNIKSFKARNIKHPNITAKVSLGTDGLHAVIYEAGKSTLYIDPFTKDNKEYIVYKRNSLPEKDHNFKCLIETNANKKISEIDGHQKVNDGKLRTFRMALSCTGEYAQFHLSPNQQNISDTATDAVKKEAILSAMNTSMTRINGVLEKELAIKLELVANNDELIFLDPATDGMTDDNPDTLLGENQSICDNVIGSQNYDIGHVFSTSGGTLSGVAVLGSACVSGQKARGVTGLGSPVGDAYDIDLVIHELGHQFGATHTQNNDCNRTSSTAVEPGSGSTIMGYAGICSPNVQSGNSDGNSDDYFHAVSIAQILNLLDTSASCATETETNNTTPTVSAGADYNIPKSTPFKLTAEGSDADTEDSLTYNWEQIDNEVGAMPPNATNAQGPMFRSLPSKTAVVRYFPDLTTIVAGNTSTRWEVLPSVERELNFSVTIRDNHSGGGSTARDDMKINIIDTAPFTVTAPTTAVTWNTGSTQTITWNKGETDIDPINSTLVNIKLSIDGGITFPITIKANTPNDGTEEISIPDNPTTAARIMVEAADNVFYNVNSTNFTIQSGTSTFVINNTTGQQIACNSGNESVNFNLNFDFVNGFSEAVAISNSGEPAGANVSFSQNSITSEGDVTMTISNFDGSTAQDYEIDVIGTSTSVTQSIKVNLKIISAEFETLTLTSPANGLTGTNLSQELVWNEDTNATSYDIEIARDSGFLNIVSSGTVITNSYISTNLISLTEYFWRVKPRNKCGDGTFSNAFSFTTKNGIYCSSTFTDEVGGTEFISNVTFGSINNNSDNDTEDGYQDFTSINTYVLRGESQEISVTFDPVGFQDHCYVFIDWNQDFEFDNATERYDLGTITNNAATTRRTIEIPNTARIGRTRMRVVVEYEDPDDGFGEGACDSDHLTEWGETEDYSVTVSDVFSVLSTSESCPDNNDGSIKIEVNSNENTYRATITGASTSITQSVDTNGLTLQDLEPGLYSVCIETIELSTTQCFEVTVQEAAEISLKVSAEKSTNTFSFKIDKGSPPFEIFVDDELIGITSQRNFDFNITERGTLKVKTAKACEGIFEKSIGELLSIDNPNLEVLLISNPVKNYIDLNLPSNLDEKNTQVTIFDLTGKLILNEQIEIKSNSIHIPFKNYAKGIYILKLSIKNAKPIKILKQ